MHRRYLRSDTFGSDRYRQKHPLQSISDRIADTSFIGIADSSDTDIFCAKCIFWLERVYKL